MTKRRELTMRESEKNNVFTMVNLKENKDAK